MNRSLETEQVEHKKSTHELKEGVASSVSKPDVHNKPMLTVEEQIAHLKEKGVKFELCSEETAATYLSEKCNFFRVAAYRKLFDKHIGGEKDGQYVGLDFAQLHLLAELDQKLRDALLLMALDVEHFAKVKLLHMLSLQKDEDGYSIVADYRASMKSQGMTYVESELKLRRKDVYCGAIMEKYEKDMPAWAFLEMVSFGTLVSMMGFCAKRWDDDDLMLLHYQLKYVKSVRNAACHSSCILNDFGDKTEGDARISTAIARIIAHMEIPKKRRSRKLRNVRMQQIATLLYLYANLVPKGGSRSRAITMLESFYEAVCENAAILPKSNSAISSSDFMKQLTDGFNLID